ncbi:MAG: hypothetical protein IJ068_05415 [Bacilli bacterium]|nr:hypothetical protein [Bacilli bacterium]
MKIKDIFKEVFVGVNLSNYSKNDETEEVYMFKKDNIVFNSILYNNYGYTKFNKEPYKYLPNKDLIKVKVSKKIKDKYYLRFGDVVISVKKPYKTFNDVIVKNNKIMVNNNYIVLRKIDSDKYYEPYISMYLEFVGIEKYLKNDGKKLNSELSIEDIKNIEIPDISKKKQINLYFTTLSYIRNIIESQESIQKILREDD